MSLKYFGTDGIRGVANELLTPHFALELGYAAAAVFSAETKDKRIAIGRDTRASGSMLADSLKAAFYSSGWDVVDLGVVPTPTVSYLVRNGAASFGVVVTASHNPAPDNGIKFFSGDGRKISENLERSIEVELGIGKSFTLPIVLGQPLESSMAIESYLEFLKSGVQGDLVRFKVALDCANGAASFIGPRVFRELGADVFSANCHPNGVNINSECGATKPEVIQRLTVETGADFGVSWDGDADRAVFSDEKGQLINGDKFMAAWATCHRSELNGPKYVGTVMSNTAFEVYLQSIGSELLRAPVGDKYVSELIDREGAVMGGEQSGHIVIPKNGPTGDGLATALAFAQVLSRTGSKASHWADVYQAWPQRLYNLSIENPKSWDQSEIVQSALAKARQSLGDRGRLQIRPSGTQPVLRVMIESESLKAQESASYIILGALDQAYGAKIKSQVDLTASLGE